MQSIVNGFAQGSVIAISALAFALVTGTTKGLHLAHGAIVAAAGMIAVAVTQKFAIGPVQALLCAAAAGVASGIIIEIAVYWPLSARRAGQNALLLASLGIHLVLTGFLVLGFGQAALFAPGGITVLQLGTTSLSVLQQMQIVSAFLVCTAAYLTFRLTSAGKLLRAQADDPELLDVLGGKTRRLRLAAAALGGGIAGLAGGLVGLDVGMDSSYALGASITAAVAAMLGGSALSVKPAAAGLAIGILQAQVGAFTSQKWVHSVSYVILAAFLVRHATAHLHLIDAEKGR